MVQQPYSITLRPRMRVHRSMLWAWMSGRSINIGELRITPCTTRSLPEGSIDSLKQAFSRGPGLLSTDVQPSNLALLSGTAVQCIA